MTHRAAFGDHKQFPTMTSAYWRWAFAIPLLASAFLAAPGCDSEASDTAAAHDGRSDIAPLVASLLDLKGEAQALPQFMNQLEGLAKSQGWHAQFLQCHKFTVEGRAMLLRRGQTQYVLVVLKSCSPVRPGRDAQMLILLDNKGNLLDNLACDISNRIHGKFHTVVAEKPERDGAELVIGLDGESARGNFSHHIRHDDSNADFHCGHYDWPRNQPTKWDARGLCRIAIQGAKFKVLFPKQGDSEPRPTDG